MSEDTTAFCSAGLPNCCRMQMMQEHSREDLRLDCLRLALQRQGARDSRELLVIAEEYYDWVTAESSGEEAVISEALPASLDWKARPSPSSARERLTLGARTATSEPKPKGRARQTRSKIEG